MRRPARRHRKRVWLSAMAMTLPLFLAASLPETSVAQSGSVSLTLDPPSAILPQNEIIEVGIVIDAQSQPTDAAQVVLSFDPALLQAVDAAGNPALSVEFGPLINDLWPVKLFNQVDHGSGKIVIAAAKGLPGQGGFTANQAFVLAIVRFKALESADNTLISFDVATSPSDWKSKVFSEEISGEIPGEISEYVEVTGLVTGASISITALVDPSSTPVPAETPVHTPSPAPPANIIRGGGGGGGVFLPPPAPTIAFTTTPRATDPVPATVAPTVEVVPETPEQLAVLPDPPETAIPLAAVPEVARPESITPETAVPEAAVGEALPATQEPAGLPPADPPTDFLEASGDASNGVWLYLGIGLFIGLLLIGVIGRAFLADGRLKGMVLRRR